MLNPFGVNGIEAVIATGLVCLCVFACVFVSGAVTVKVSERVCAAVESAVGALSVAVQAWAGERK